MTDTEYSFKTVSYLYMVCMTDTHQEIENANIPGKMQIFPVKCK